MAECTIEEIRPMNPHYSEVYIIGYSDHQVNVNERSYIQLAESCARNAKATDGVQFMGYHNGRRLFKVVIRHDPR